MRCPHCQAANPDHHQFCGHCGRRLGKGPPPVAGDPINQVGDAIIEQELQKMQEQAQVIEVQTLEKLMERAVKWGRLQLAMLFTALSILAVALGLLGYRGYQTYENFNQLVADKEKKINELMAEQQASADASQQAMKEMRDKMLAAADATLADARRLLTDIQDSHQSVEHLEQKIKTLKIEEMLVESQQLHQDVLADRQAINKLQNSFYRVTIQVDPSSPVLKAKIPALISRLRESGFLMTAASVIEIEVEQNELIYYNRGARNKAEELQALLDDSFGRPPLREIALGEQDPRELVIKLAAGGF